LKHFVSKMPMYELPNQDERRRVKRHPLRSRALIGVPGQPSIRGSMLDISVGAVGLISPMSLAIGSECSVFFTVTVQGQLIAVSGTGKVVNSICSGDGFRVGMLFHTQDTQAQKALDKLLSAP